MFAWVNVVTAGNGIIGFEEAAANGAELLNEDGRERLAKQAFNIPRANLKSKSQYAESSREIQNP